MTLQRRFYTVRRKFPLQRPHFTPLPIWACEHAGCQLSRELSESLTFNDDAHPSHTRALMTDVGSTHAELRARRQAQLQKITLNKYCQFKDGGSKR
mmetsp:Transcript_55250/g.89533  ORF Transcript_55250/g.89533 Transcript_55250/m.89533 type:complete len:96 (-) Transcript_55250:76-363(-)